MNTKWTSVDDILLAAYCDREAASFDRTKTVTVDAYIALLDSYEYMADDNEKLRRENRRSNRALLLASGLGALGWILLWIALWLLVTVWR